MSDIISQMGDLTASLLSFKLNFELAQRYFVDSVGVKAIAIAPSYIPKTGKHTPSPGTIKIP